MLHNIVKHKDTEQAYEIIDVKDEDSYTCCYWPYDGGGYFHVNKADVGNVNLINDKEQVIQTVPVLPAPRQSER